MILVTEITRAIAVRSVITILSFFFSNYVYWLMAVITVIIVITVNNILKVMTVIGHKSNYSNGPYDNV